MTDTDTNDAAEPDDGQGELVRAAGRLESAVTRSIRNWMDRRRILEPDAKDQPWILAVSGGADSMAMLHAIDRSYPGKRLIVAHMNHHSREESDVDERFVAAAAAALGHVSEVGHWRPVRRSHFEADARRARHAWLKELAEDRQALGVMTAHTQDDQAETVLMRLARGTGPWGMGGMRPFRRLGSGSVDLVRPLLSVGRGDVLAYLRNNRIAFREDPTNTDIENQTRAWVRHVLMPQIEGRLNPRFREAVGHFASLQAEEQDGLESLVRSRARKTGSVRIEAGSMHISLRAYVAFGPSWLRRRLLRTFWSDAGFPQRGMSRSHWVKLDDRLRRALNSERSGRISFPARLTLSIRGDHAEISRDAPAAELPGLRCPVEVSCPGRAGLDGDQEIVAEGPIDVPGLEALRAISGQGAFFDAGVVRPPMRLRRPQPGDRFDPLGMDGHHQKLTDYLRIRGIKGAEKAGTWVLEDKSGIVWVVGHGISERVKVRESTRSVLAFRIESARERNG